jgi:hypothetical protein
MNIFLVTLGDPIWQIGGGIMLSVGVVLFHGANAAPIVSLLEVTV